MIKYFIFACVLISTLTIITLKKDQLGSDYQIGTISDLFFSINDRIFFRSDDNTFGFISQLDGSILQVYKLENDEKLISFSENLQLFLSRNKTINIFTPKDGTYSPATANSYLKKYSNFTSIIDFIPANTSAMILTDQYLMKIPIITIQKQNNQQKLINSTLPQTEEVLQEILIKFNDKNEQLYGLNEFFNWRINKVDYYISSILMQQNITKMCFRTVSNLNQSALCMPIPMNEAIVDIVTTSTYIYVYFKDYSLAFTILMEFIKKIDSKPLQPFKGFLSLGNSHQYFDPVARTIFDTKIIVDYPIFQGGDFKTMKVEERLLVVLNGDKQIVKISKDSKENPRKVWSYLKDSKQTSFRLYIQFESGRLVCYQINSQNNSYQNIWELLEILDINQAIASSGNNHY